MAARGEGSDFEQRNFFDPEIQRCPFPYYEWLRAEQPVHWDESLKTYILSIDEFVRAAALDWRTFSNVGSQDFGASTESAAEAAAIRASTYATKPLTVSIDPPSHTQYRKIMNAVLSQKRMHDCKDWIDATAGRLVQDMLRDGGGDFIEKVAAMLPFALILHLLGLPPEMIEKMREWAMSYIEPLTGAITPEREIECARLYVEYHQFLEQRIEAYRAAESPPDNVIAAVSQARLDNGELLSMTDALSILEQFVTAGAETTTSAIGMGAFALARNPELLATIRSDDERIAAFCEEILRLYAPAQGLFRTVMQDVEIGGVAIPAGARIMLRWGAANTDEAVFARPLEIDLRRPNPRKHMAFGYGIHACQGAPLARLELAATFRALAALVADMSIDEGFGPLEYIQGIIFLGLKKLPLRLRPLGETPA